jgi:hypothetical protein
METAHEVTTHDKMIDVVHRVRGQMKKEAPFA